jgi:hypothetical protein
MSKVLNKGSSVVKEYITIIESYFENRNKMLGYLKKRELSCPESGSILAKKSISTILD